MLVIISKGSYLHKLTWRIIDECESISSTFRYILKHFLWFSSLLRKILLREVIHQARLALQFAKIEIVYLCTVFIIKTLLHLFLLWFWKSHIRTIFSCNLNWNSGCWSDFISECVTVSHFQVLCIPPSKRIAESYWSKRLYRCN